jgi:lysozyme
MASKDQKVRAGSGIVAALALAVPLVGNFEGERLDPYRDIVGKWTVCRGETNVAMRHYTKAECEAMLYKSIASRAAPVVDCVPQLAARPYQLAASLSLAYNIGTQAFCRSSAAADFRAGRDYQACAAFELYDRAGGEVVAGLVRRRQAERQLCERGL